MRSRGRATELSPRVPSGQREGGANCGIQLHEPVKKGTPGGLDVPGDGGPLLVRPTFFKSDEKGQNGVKPKNGKPEKKTPKNEGSSKTRFQQKRPFLGEGGGGKKKNMGRSNLGRETKKRKTPLRSNKIRKRKKKGAKPQRTGSRNDSETSKRVLNPRNGVKQQSKRAVEKDKRGRL